MFRLPPGSIVRRLFAVFPPKPTYRVAQAAAVSMTTLLSFFEYPPQLAIPMKALLAIVGGPAGGTAPPAPQFAELFQLPPGLTYHPSWTPGAGAVVVDEVVVVLVVVVLVVEVPRVVVEVVVDVVVW
jgi:hypothetical protein